MKLAQSLPASKGRSTHLGLRYVKNLYTKTRNKEKCKRAKGFEWGKFCALAQYRIWDSAAASKMWKNANLFSFEDVKVEQQDFNFSAAILGVDFS